MTAAIGFTQSEYLKIVDDRVCRATPEIKKKWEKANCRLPKESLILLAGLSKKCQIPREDIMNYALLNAYHEFAATGRFSLRQVRPTKNADVQLRLL